MGFKVKIRVTHPEGRREKYSFQLQEGELFPLGSQTEGLMHSYPGLTADEAAILVHEGQVLFRGERRERPIQSGDERAVGPFRIEVLELIRLEATAQTRSTALTQMRTAQPAPAEEKAEPSFTPSSLYVPEPTPLSSPEPSFAPEASSLPEATRVGAGVSESLHAPDRVTLTTLTREDPSLEAAQPRLPESTGFTQAAASRPESTATSLRYQERFEKTSATAMIQRRRNLDDRITKISLISAAVATVVAVPLYFGWIPLGDSTKNSASSEAVAQFPSAGADPWAKAPVETVSAVAETKPAAVEKPAPAATVAATTSAPSAPPVARHETTLAPPPAFSAIQPPDPMHVAELHEAASAGNVAVLTHLIEARKIDLNAFSPEGRTPLMTAAAAGKVEAVQLLVARGALVNTTDRLGTTALMWATMKGQFKAVMALVDAGAEPGMARLDGDTAYQIAERWGYKRMAQFLSNPRGYRRAQERAVAQQAAAKTRAAEKERTSARKPASSSIQRPATSPALQRLLKNQKKPGATTSPSTQPKRKDR